MKNFKEFLLKTKNFVLDALFPSDLKCIFCERDIPDYQHLPFCVECEKIALNVGNRCMFCDVQIPEGNKVCDFCAQNHRDFEHTFCPLVYRDQVRSTMLKFKNDNAKYLAEPLAKLICARILADDVKIDLIVPVPTKPKTLKSRGYNQSELLASEIAKLMGCECKNIVAKVKDTADQKSLKFAKRLTNLEGSFELTDKKLIKGKNVLIVDDIMTTGSTLNEIAKLMKGKAAHIYVAAAARDNFGN